MFTAIIRTRNEPLALGATIGPLVRGVVQGLVGSAIMVATQDAQEIDEIANSAGCRVIVSPGWEEGFARAVAITGGAPLIVVDTGILLGQDFWPMLADHLPALGDRPAVTLPASSNSLPTALMRRLRRLGGRIDADSALLLPVAKARTIALARLDPFRVRYGKSLVHLRTAVLRVELG